MKLIVCFLIALICPGLIFCQKKFKVSFLLSDSTEIKKLSFFYYDCQKRDFRPIAASYDNNEATISHIYNTVFAQIYVEYGFGDSRPGMSIFTTEKPATVTIPLPIDATNPFNSYTLMNAQDIKQEFSAAEE